MCVSVSLSYSPRGDRAAGGSTLLHACRFRIQKTTLSARHRGPLFESYILSPNIKKTKQWKTFEHPRTLQNNFAEEVRALRCETSFAASRRAALPAQRQGEASAAPLHGDVTPCLQLEFEEQAPQEAVSTDKTHTDRKREPRSFRTCGSHLCSTVLDMAGLCGLRLLLLAAGLIGTANCEENDTSPPSPQCQYTVKASGTGFLFTYENEGNYTVKLIEQNTNDSIVKPMFLNNTQTVQYLKPSTVYNYSIEIGNGSMPNAKCGQNATETNKIDRGNITTTTCNPYICYKTNWNISAEQSHDAPASCRGKDKYAFCIRPNYTDLCTNVMTALSSTNLTLTEWIGHEFLNTTDIKLDVDKRLPPKINWTNEVCDLKIDYICQELKASQTDSNWTLEQLEPYTNYTCTGEIKNQTGSLINMTVTKMVHITCDDLTLHVTNSTTKDSIQFQLKTSSTRCPNISSHQGLSYRCGCSASGGSGSTVNCTVHHLKPFTDYNCTIQAYFKKVEISQTKVIGAKTKAGVPSTPSNIVVTYQENNAFDVTCAVESRNGPNMTFTAWLTQGNTDERQRHIENAKCIFQFKDLSYSTTYNLWVTAFNGVRKSDPANKQIQTHYNDKAVIGFLVFLIMLTSVALAFVLYRIYILQRNKAVQGENILLISSTNDEDQLMRVEPIGAEVLLDVYKKKIADEGRLFLAEFQSIPRIFSKNTMKEAKKSHNAVKNRYVDILPYDFNRVQLTTGNGEAGCDYINASFVNGFQEPKKYIAAQGPKDETVAGFWRMIWEQKSSIIVMVTRCEEGNKVKCAQYWPSVAQEAQIFEEFVVKLYKEEQCPHYIIRQLILSNKREHSEREVTQIQFISWPDHGVPDEPQLLLKLRKRVNAFKNLFSGPIVVHCSAGVGRTGTYISIDAMIEGLESEGQMDIYGYIVSLRKQRCLMVQVETQYILIHQAMVEHTQFGETEISLSEFHSTLSMLKETGPGREPSLLQEEFQKLPKYNNWRTCNTGLTEENKKKNRFSSVIPYDYNRVFVKLDDDHNHDRNHEEEDDSSSSEEEDEESMKYINASHIEGYWGPEALITAQSPLADTTADFWLMVYQKKAKALVMLSDSTQGAAECSPYWDQDKKAFEDIEVEVTETECTPVFTTRTMTIYHTKRKESRRVKQFHFSQWSYRKLPENSLQLTDMIRTIKQTCGYNGPQEGRGPLVVHCSNGSCQSGVFCALWNLMDSANTERMADVFQVAKSLRKERQGMISSQEQYQFLYEAVAAAFPAQNEGVTAAPATVAADDVKIVDETGLTQEGPGVSATDGQQVAVAVSAAGASTPLLERPTKEEQDEAASKPTAVEATSNGSTVTVEV